MTATYNVVIAGKTGTGKSSLINYLYGAETRKTGAGKPVTERGFAPIDHQINGLNVKLFDSWGLEVGKEEEWMRLLDEELNMRGTDKPVEDWFHSVFYCIGGSGHRMEDFDAKIIKKFMYSNYNVIVILTKADTISQKQKKEMIDTICRELGNTIKIIPVCTQENEFPGGYIAKPFGKKELELETYNNFWNSIVLRLPERCVRVLEQKINAWGKEQLEYINNNTGLWNDSKIKEYLETQFQSFIDKEFKKQSSIKEEIQKLLKLYGTFFKSLNYHLTNNDVQISLKKENMFNSLIRKIHKLECALFMIPLLPTLLMLPMYIFQAKIYNKLTLLLHMDKLVTDLKNKLPSIEEEIKNSLIKMQEPGFEEKNITIDYDFIVSHPIISSETIAAIKKKGSLFSMG